MRQHEYAVNHFNSNPPYDCSVQSTPLIGRQVACLVNKIFIDAQLSKPVVSDTAVLARCFYLKEEAWSKVKSGGKGVQKPSHA